MGGYGSGRSIGWRGPTVGSYYSIDIRKLRKAGQLGRPGDIVQWRSGVWIEFVANAVDITFDLADGSTYRVFLDETPCHLGGSRKWFLCPRCEQRTVELHLVGDALACRCCCGLNYGSQREGAADRARRRERKIRKRLGMGVNLFEPIEHKPSRMHWRTFFRLRDQANAHGRVSLADMLRFVDRRRPVG